jgi:hypothetical protein
MQPVPLIQCIGSYIWLSERALRENTECSDPYHISSRSICLPIQTKAIICFLVFNWRSPFYFILNGHVNIPSHSLYNCCCLSHFCVRFCCSVYVCMYVCMYVCIYVCVYIHTHIHTHTHIPLCACAPFIPSIFPYPPPRY